MRGLGLLVGRVAVLAEAALHEDAEVGPDVLADGPVDGDVGLDGGHQLAGDVAQRLVAEHGHGGVVGLERVVEGQLVLGQAQRPRRARRAARMSLARAISSSMTWAVSMARFW